MSLTLTENLLALPEVNNASCIMAFLAMPGESNLDEFIRIMLKNGTRICIPVCLPKRQIEAGRIMDMEHFEKGPLGLRNIPSGYDVIEPEQIDLVLVPAVACDRQGRRLGMGAGYYDRYLVHVPYEKRIAALWDFQVLDEDIPGSKVPKVFADNVQGGRIATEKLIAAGHRHIAFVGGPDKLMSVRERYQGFCTAMEQAGLSWPPEWVMYGDYQREFGQQALRYLFSQPVRPTAVFAASDYLVLGLLDGLRASGLQAPEALSLVGFDDANYADFTQPRISTIRQPARELGRTAVNIMMRLLNDDPDIPAETRLPVEWIGRDSIKIC